MLFTEKEREMRETQEMVAHKLAQTEQRAATTQQVIIEKYRLSKMIFTSEIRRSSK